MNTADNINDWKQAHVQDFWGEVAPDDHLVQIYENDNHFLNTLEGFAGSAIISGDSVVVIATQTHLDQLYERLLQHSFDMESLIQSNRYIPLEAHETLSQFMVDGMPDEDLFNQCITRVLQHAKTNGNKVRAFGEMVAILWEQGNAEATVKLETLWHKLHAADLFSLFCAYPKSGFADSGNESLYKICQAHSKIIDGQNRPSTEIYYNNLN